MRKVKIEAKFPPSVVRVIDYLIEKGLYRSRSEAVALLIRGHLDSLGLGEDADIPGGVAARRQEGAR